MGPWSWVENLDLGSTIYHLHPRPFLLISPHSKASREHYWFTGAWIQSFRPTIKCLSDPGESNPTTRLCFPFACFLECPWLY